MSVNDLKTFDVTLRTKYRTLSSAEAKSWLADRCDQDAMPYDSSIEAEEESAKPHLGEEHPAARCTHALIDAQHALSQWTKQAEYGPIRDLVGEALDQHAKFFQLFIRTERALEEVRLEALTEKRTRERLERINTGLVERHNTARNTAKKLIDYIGCKPSLSLSAAQRLLDELAPQPATFTPRPNEADTITAPMALRIAP